MATQESALQEIQQVIAGDPNNEIAKQVQTVLERLAGQPQFGQIPSINEFSDLLHEVTTELENESHFNDNDILLLKISDKLTIYFDKNDTKNQYPKLAIISDPDEVDQATNTLEMTKFDIFNCLLIGCRKIFASVSNESIKQEMIQDDCVETKNGDAKNKEKAKGNRKEKEKEREPLAKRDKKQNVLDQIFFNMWQYLSNCGDEELNDGLKEDIASIWSLLKLCMSFNDVFDKQCWIYRLAMILMISSDGDEDGGDETFSNFKQLSFVDEKEDELLNGLFISKNRQSLSLLKQKLVKIGCFSEVYSLIMDKSTTNVTILAKFVAYYCYFEKLWQKENDKQNTKKEENDGGDDETQKNSKSEGQKNHFLLSMQEPKENLSLFGAARARGNVNLANSISKYIVKNEMINEKLSKYGDYFNQMVSVLRQLTTVELLTVFLRFVR